MKKDITRIKLLKDVVEVDENNVVIYTIKLADGQELAINDVEAEDLKELLLKTLK